MTLSYVSLTHLEMSSKIVPEVDLAFHTYSQACLYSILLKLESELAVTRSCLSCLSSTNSAEAATKNMLFCCIQGYCSLFCIAKDSLAGAAMVIASE